MKARGQELGTYCRSEITGAAMGKIVYDDMHKDFKNMLLKTGPLSLIIGIDRAFTRKKEPR